MYLPYDYDTVLTDPRLDPAHRPLSYAEMDGLSNSQLLTSLSAAQSDSADLIVTQAELPPEEYELAKHQPLSDIPGYQALVEKEDMLNGEVRRRVQINDPYEARNSSDEEAIDAFRRLPETRTEMAAIDQRIAATRDAVLAARAPTGIGSAPRSPAQLPHRPIHNRSCRATGRDRTTDHPSLTPFSSPACAAAAVPK
ncbi:hypothetical protein ACIRCZ_19500 [Leifsonia sp. NPDC102414]|uniref:hypothetical protein n=1 Tax=Leifsonia sp. NPDC102414 TaxID=3364124 RepID=UPI00381E9A16